MDMVKCREHTR